MLPTPVAEKVRCNRDRTLICGQSGEVLVRVAGDRITVAEYAVKWHGPHTPVVTPKVLGSVRWNRTSADACLTVLRTLFDSAVEIRKAKYRACDHCGETTPPEFMHDEMTCMGCAQQHLGVVY
jgi:hypothetical protein